MMLSALRRTVMLAGLLAAAGPALADMVTYRFDPQHSRVWWEVRHFGTSTHRGRFDAAPQGVIGIDRDAGRGEVSLSLETASVSSGVPALDTMIRGNGFLASEANPNAYFVASRFRLAGGAPGEVRGEFTLRGVSQPLSLHAKSFTCRDDATLQREVCGGDFEAELLRSAYGSTFGIPFVGDRVRLLISVEAIRD